jgi:aminopeptidase N
MSSISNMPIVNSSLPIESGSDYVWDRYQQSVRMSTYLVAFVVSKLKNIELIREDGLMLRIWADSNSIDQTGFAMDVLPKMLKHFEGFFKLKFPLPKIDMIAIPDFAFGAMENWGLITYT